MKPGPAVKKIIYSSWFLAAIPAIMIMLFLPPIGSKYKLLITEEDKLNISDLYRDLDSDSVTEIIRLGKGVPYYNILVMDNNYHVYDQWNLHDDVDSDLSDVFFGNFDNDRFAEIYIFTHKNDSLFLNINEFFDPAGTRMDRVYITKIGFLNNKVTSYARTGGFFDNNGDGSGELYFSIQTGFGLEPRRLYSFDIVHQTLKSSQFTGMICQWPVLADIDGDNKPEIFGVMGASGNYKTSPPYSDRSTWLMVFDENLKFEFPPVEFPGFPSELKINGYKNANFKGYLVSHYSGSADKKVLKPRIMLFSADGKLIRDKPFSDYGFFAYTDLEVVNHNQSCRIFLFSNDFLEINNQFEVINRTKSPFHSYFTVTRADIDFDGEEEFLLYSEKEEKLVILNSSLDKLSENSLKANMSVMNISYFVSKDHEHKLHLASTDNGYFLSMIRNKYYFFGLLSYPGIYLSFLLLILLTKKITTYQVIQKEGLKQRLITLQLQGIKSQLDPHFTFNTLNSVASLIYLEDRGAAYDYMNKFTMLLRGMLNDAERIYRTLGEEIEFVTTYLDLEKLRLGGKFNYSIEIGEGLTQRERVPKLVLHTFAENSVKHGIMPSPEGGFIKLSAFKEHNWLKLTVEDNGIGRQKAAGKSNSTGKGLKLTSEFYDILNQINKNPIRHKITDLHSETGDAAGTRVEVWVPLDQ
jgi:sensor histidine kinase YesM